MGVSWLTAELGVEYREWHFRSGYLIAGLLLFRLLWGIAGTRYARFHDFIRGPVAVLGYLRRGSEAVDHYPGHSPLGALAVVAILAALITQVVTGFFADDDIAYTGPYRYAVSGSLANDMTDLHHQVFDVIKLLLLLHLAAIAWYVLRRKEPLLSAMWHGHKPAAAFTPSYPPLSAPGTAFWLRALLCVGLAAGCIWALLAFAPEPVYDDFYY